MNVVVLSIGVDETRQTAVNWRETYNLSSPVMVDPTGDMYDPYSLGLFPLNVILDETNTIRYQEIHFNEFEIRSLLSDLSAPLVKIDHTPLHNTEDNVNDYPVTAEIRCDDPLLTPELKLVWETDHSDGTETLVPTGGNTFTATIPRQEHGIEVRYYLRAESTNGQTAFHPNTGPMTQHTFNVFQDTSPPVVTHTPLEKWRGDLWSPKITALVTDELPSVSAVLEFRINQGDMFEVPMNQSSSGIWQAWFSAPAVTDDIVEYRIRARDSAAAENTAFSPETGYYQMEIIDPVPALILDLDQNQISGPVIQDALVAAGVFAEIVTEWPANLDHYRSLWVTMGSGQNQYEMSFDESVSLEDYMESGNPVYLECSNCWLNPQRFNSLNDFNVRATGDSFAIAGQLEGLNDTIGHGLLLDYDGRSRGVNPIQPVSRSEVIFKSIEPEFNTSVVSTSEAGPTVASVFEMGKVAVSQSPSIVDILVERYADFFGLIDLASCNQPEVTIDISSLEVKAGDQFALDVAVCNPQFRVYENTPLFVILEINQQLLFWPTFSEFDFQTIDLMPGESEHVVIEPFQWPDGVASGSATWYAAMTDAEVSAIFGEFDTVTFTW